MEEEARGDDNVGIMEVFGDVAKIDEDEDDDEEEEDSAGRVPIENIPRSAFSKPSPVLPGSTGGTTDAVQHELAMMVTIRTMTSELFRRERFAERVVSVIRIRSVDGKRIRRRRNRQAVAVTLRSFSK